MPDYEKVKEQFKNEEGCNMKGVFLVNKVIISNNRPGPRKFPFIFSSLCSYSWKIDSKGRGIV